MSVPEIYSKERGDYSDKYEDHALEQYKLYVEMADRISARRQTANTFFVSLNTILITMAGYAKSATSTEWFFYFVTSLAGLIICYIWFRLVKSYKNLNSGKFKVVHAIERELPFKLFDAEWEALGGGRDNSLYQPFTHLELRVPWVFGVIHMLVVFYVLPWRSLVEVCHASI